jgi:hypothetical protein
MTMTPIARVERPQLFCQAKSLFPRSFGSSTSMPNILEKFCPRQCEVAAWMPRPVVGMKPSTVVVYRPPANFSFSDLIPGTDGDREELFIHPSVEVKDFAHFRVGFFFRQEGGVPLLPEEFASANERLWRLELPSDDAVPLVELQGEITVALYPLCVVYKVD